MPAILLVAVLCFVLGKVGLALAVPPGYATVVWPASGVAVGTLILFGARLWPGIFLGSLVLNVSLGGLPGVETAIAWDKMAVAVAIATGSTVQALLARWLVVRMFGNPLEFGRALDIVKFCALVGPVSCLVAASVGTGALYVSGVVDAANALTNWWTWWAGDLVGIAIFLPITLMMPGVPRRMKFRGTDVGGLPAALMVIVMIPLGLTFYAWKATSEHLHDRGTEQFHGLAVANESALFHRIDSYEQSLVGGLGFFRGSNNVTRDEWTAFVDAQNIEHRYPGINGIGYIANVRSHELADYTASVRESVPDFRVHPDTAGRPHYVIEFIEPIEINKEALGLNIGFEDNRTEAANVSRDTGRPAITKRILLVQDATKSPGFLLLHPRYDAAMPVGTVAQRRAALLGWVYAPFVGRSFMAGLTPSQGELLNIRVYDGNETSSANLIYASDGIEAADLGRGAFTVQKQIDVMEQRWTVVWTSTAQFERSVASSEPSLILVGGLIFTVLFATLLLFFARRAETVKQLVAIKTDEIAASEEQLRLLVQHTPAAVAMFDRDMRYIMTSERWITDYELADQEVVGRTHFEVFPELLELPHWVETFERALAGEVLHEEEDYWERRDHLPEWVKWSIRPWYDAAGETGGVVMFSEVITQRKRAELREQILREISVEAVETTSVVDLLASAVDKLCKHFPWHLGHVLVWDGATRRLVSSGVWKFGHETERFDEFRQHSAEMSFAVGEGLAGNALADRRPIYDSEFHKTLRHETATDVPARILNAALAVPVFVGDEPIAVLELYSHERARPTEGGIKFLDLLSIQLSRIVERSRFEDALAKSNSLNNAVLNSADYLVIATDYEGQVLVFNSAAERKTGYAAEEMIGQKTAVDWHDADELRYHAEDLATEFGDELEPGFASFVRRAELTGRDSGEWTINRKDGSSFPAFVTLTPMHDEDDTIAGFVIIIVDITLRKLQDAELRASQEAFGTAMENATSAMALVDLDRHWVKVNPALCRLLGRTSDELEGIDFNEVTHPDDRGTSTTPQRELINGERGSYNVEKRYIHKSGRTIHADVNVSLAHDANGEPKWFIAQIEDVSGRREMERLKSEFISVVSHELRTPLTSIRGSLGLLAGTMSEKMPAQANQLIDIALKNCERLIPLINDILDMDKIASGNMPFDMKSEPINAAVENAVEVNRAYADRFGVTFTFEPAEGEPSVHVDAARLAQVLANLLSNAAKFSPENGNVQVTAEATAGRVRVCVIDKGQGIPEKFRDRIFAKFSQADSSVTREKGGTGLGLHISKQMVERMDGTIGFDSVEGEGTTFWVELPLAEGEAGADLEIEAAAEAPASDSSTAEAPDDQPPPGDLPRVLHVEDDVDVSTVLSTALNGRAVVESVRTIAEAKNRLSNSTYDAIVLDISLTDGIGLTLIREFRQTAGTIPPVIVLSAYEAPASADVAAKLVKSMVTEEEIVKTVLSCIEADRDGSEGELLAG